MVQEKLRELIRAALPKLKSCETEKVVSHLTSEKVGVAEEEDFQFISEKDLTGVLGSVQIKRLLDALAKYENEDNTPEPGTSAATVTGPQARLPSSTHQPDPTVFSFSVPWNDLPRDVLKRMKTVEDLAKDETIQPKDRQADIKDIRALKLAISKKLVIAYNAYKTSYPSKSKTPGAVIYKNITEQVFARFTECLIDIIGEKVVGNGKGTFEKCLLVCVENLMRQKKETTTRASAIVGRGTVGVLASEYNPTITPEEEQKQTELKGRLQKIFKETRRSDWILQELLKDMHMSYALQRADLIKAKMRIQAIEDSEDIPEDLENYELLRLKEEWPFLFEPRWLSQHFQILTGHLLNLPLENYIEKDMQNVLRYLESHGPVPIKNMALQIKWNEAGGPPSTKLLLLVQMIANYFREDHKIIILTAEKTTRPEEIKRLPNIPVSPCIIVLGDNEYLAEKFITVIDRVAIVETCSFKEALLALFEAVFVFDVEYPAQLNHTMEYLERVVLGLGLSQTRVKQKTNRITVISVTVLRLVNSTKKFGEELDGFITQ